MDKSQLIQDSQYSYPYHYIPTLGDNVFSQVQYWSWGFRYMGGLQIVIDQLKDRQFESLVDVGCGDGRLLKELTLLYPEKRLLGVDYSQRAILLAQALNPSLDYDVVDIIENPLLERFDVVTLVEVLEHIPIMDVRKFLDSISSTLNQTGQLILTVPHKNSPLIEKHVQHFSSDSLVEILEPYFREIDCIPFDPLSKIMGIIRRVMGGKGNHFLITNKKLLYWMFQIYRRYFLYAKDESSCKRIAVVCKKK